MLIASYGLRFLNSIFQQKVGLSDVLDVENSSYIFCRVIVKMMLDKMVPNVISVFTTLAFLNSIGIVLSQDEREHGLATNCDNKGMKTPFQKFSKFVDKVRCISENICGDKCYRSDKKCYCGDTTVKISDYKYCCIQMNETCKVQGMFSKAK